MSAATQSYRDQSIKPMQGMQTTTDRFGLLGLLSVIRMNDADLTSLALGIDLTTLGLSLNSSDNLYKTFASPWSDEPAKGEPEYTIPNCYYSKQPPPLTVSPFISCGLFGFNLVYLFSNSISFSMDAARAFC